MTQIEMDECTQCSHPHPLHVVVSPEDPLAGGFMVCPVMDCTCYATWSVNGAPPPDVDKAEAARIRTAIQTGEM